MDDTLRVINELEAEGVISRYAIGGAIGLLFYIETLYTEDLDVFCCLPRDAILITLAPLYNWLKHRGYEEEKEHVLIEGIPVQFLEPPDDLVKEALAQAVDDQYAGVPTRVFQYEHLLAIACGLGRHKDKLRIAIALESREPDEPKLRDILARHDLLDKWSAMTAR